MTTSQQPCPVHRTCTCGQAPTLTPDGPRYLTLARIEARLREDQLAELTALRRQVAAARVDRSERITDNTLIRLAVDLLLQHGDRIAGDTEDAMRCALLHDKP